MISSVCENPHDSLDEYKLYGISSAVFGAPLEVTKFGTCADEGSIAKVTGMVADLFLPVSAP